MSELSEYPLLFLLASDSAKRVATSLCRLFLGTSKMNATLLLEMILSADLEVLERRGFLG